jgi:hypothetical protein
MFKWTLILIFLVNPLIIYSQTKEKIIDCYNNIDSDFCKDCVTIQTELKGPSISDTIRDVYKVVKIDTLNKFYLIFIEKGGIRNTIYSESCLISYGKKIRLNELYFFELICKNFAYNGKCIMIIPNVTYFGKYKGCEIGNLYKAINICGLNVL